jgi:hypothetical protein
MAQCRSGPLGAYTYHARLLTARPRLPLRTTHPSAREMTIDASQESGAPKASTQASSTHNLDRALREIRRLSGTDCRHTLNWRIEFRRSGRGDHGHLDRGLLLGAHPLELRSIPGDCRRLKKILPVRRQSPHHRRRRSCRADHPVLRIPSSQRPTLPRPFRTAAMCAGAEGSGCCQSGTSFISLRPRLS